MTKVRRNYKDLLILLTVLSVSCTSRAQDATVSGPAQRTIHLAPLNLHAPFQILAILDKGKEHEHQLASLEVTFNDDDADWVKNLQLKVVNHSPKPIVAVEANLSVPAWETNQQAPKRVITFHEGQLPAHALRIPDGSKVTEESSLQVLIKPGEMGVIPLGTAGHKLATHYPDSPSPLSTAPGLWIQFERVFFADGTMWQFNAYYVPSTSLDGQYTRVNYPTWAAYTAAAEH